MTAGLAGALAALPLLALGALHGFRRPARGPLALYAAVLPFGSAIVVPVGLPPPFNTLSTMLGTVASGALAVDIALRGRRASRVLGALVAWLLFLAWAALSYLWTVDPTLTLDHLLVLVSLVALYAMVALARLDAGDVRRVEAAVIAGGVLTGLYAIALQVQGGLVAEPGAVPRFATAGGGGGEPDAGVTAATLLLPFVLAAARLLRARAVTHRALLAAVVATIAYALVLTGSRGGMLAAVVAVAVLLAHEPPARLALAASGLALVSAVAFHQAPAPVQERVGNRDTTGRAEIWEIGTRSCAAHCLVGSGFASFPTVYERTLLDNLDLAGHGIKSYKAHNIWLALTIEVGLPGVLLALVALVAVGRDLRGVPRRSRGPAVAALAALLVSNLFVSNFDFKYFWLVLTYAAMVSLAHGRPAPERSLPAGPARRLSLVRPPVPAGR